MPDQRFVFAFGLNRLTVPQPKQVLAADRPIQIRNVHPS